MKKENGTTIQHTVGVPDGEELFEKGSESSGRYGRNDATETKAPGPRDAKAKRNR